MTVPIAFFWRDVQTLKGACRAAMAYPRLDIGELRAVQANGAYTVAPEAPTVPMPEPRRLTIKDARASRTKAWHANPPSIAELFALPILAEVQV